jgi:6-phosphogluconolactonase (cycloisomerase 2 family)
LDAGIDTIGSADGRADGGDGNAGDGGGAGGDAGRPEILVVATYLGGISSLRIDPTSGALTPVTSSLDSGGQLYGVVAHPSGDFVYAADFRGRIYGYRVNRADGSLAALANLPLMTNGQAITPAIDAQGRFLYVTTSRDTLMNSGDNSLYAYRIAADSGALTPVTNSPFVLGATPTGVCFHPSGAFAYVSSSASSTTSQGGIRVFSVEPTSGVPAEIVGSPFATTLFGGALAVHPNGNFLFDSSFGVHVLAIDPTTRGVHELADSPRSGAQSDNQAVDIAVDPLAQYFYASSNLGTVTAYRLDAATAAFGPVEGSPYSLQGMPYSVAIDPTGRFAYVGNDDADQVYAFAIERASGKLQSIGDPVTVHGLQPEMVFIGP